MITPCINICKVIDNKCAGCGRTLDEISKWTKLSDLERFQIIERLNNERTLGFK